ncbi:MAG: metallophosphoesterase [Gemmataceae bacterium]
MKKMLLGLFAAAALAGAVALSGSRLPEKETLKPVIVMDREERNPFTGLRPGVATDDFQFAIVSDRTGGHRAKVFSQAMEKLELLQPEFVVSVGDVIEGTDKKPQLEKQWNEVDGYIARLSMPFFYLAGNHDAGNASAAKFWDEKLGRRHYHFVYRNVLFLMLNSEDPPGGEGIGKEQQAWLKKTLADNGKVRWTIVFVHRPLWNSAKSNWGEVEKTLGARPYTVFCGHLHRFQKYVRNGRNYYQLATTGGVSRLRGVERGEFDEIAWVTMKADGPVLAHVMLDSVFREDLRSIESAEGGVAAKREATQPVHGRVFFEGTPTPGAVVVFEPRKGSKGVRAEGTVAGDGSFLLTTYKADDGAAVGEYSVSVTWRRADKSGKAGPNLLPASYAKGATSPLVFAVRPGDNALVLELKK